MITRSEMILKNQAARVPRGKKAPEPIAKRSDKMKDLMKVYKPQVTEFLSRIVKLRWLAVQERPHKFIIVLED